LQDALLAAARDEEATIVDENRYGRLYVLDFIVTTPIGSALVRSGWIVQFTEGFPRLTTCYVRRTE
jgi:hypothetical protein